MGLKERREREREERKRQILAAARSLLFEEGLQATSVNKIARRAELGVGTIYFYFAGKEEIFAALQEEGIEVLQAMMLRDLEGAKGPEERLRSIARTYVDFSREKGDYFDIINYFLSSPGVMFNEDLKERIDQRGNRVVSLLVSTVEAGIASGDFRKVDARKFAMMFWATLHGLMLFRKLKTTMLRGEDYHALVGYAVDHLVGSIRGESNTG